MPGQFKDTAAKQIVREQWNTPLLRFLHKEYGIRYRYVGLPGVDLLDITLWRDMIEDVVAFQCRVEGNKRDPLGQRHVTEIRKKLKLWHGITTEVYEGSLEEVIHLGKDLNGVKYKQTRVMTLYNLDFCDEISSSIVTSRGDRQLWRFEAIKQILRDQRECYSKDGQPERFIILLTVRNQIGVAKIKDYLQEGLLHETDVYLNSCGGLSSLPAKGNIQGTHTWAMKALLYNMLRQYMYNPQIAAVFFPTLKYDGHPTVDSHGNPVPSPMLHIMLLCKFDTIDRIAPRAYPADYLRHTTSVRVVDNGGVLLDPEPGEISSTGMMQPPHDWFSEKRHQHRWES